MAASSVWNIQMRITTGSNAPRMFSLLKDNATKAAEALDKADKALTRFGETATKSAEVVERSFSRITQGMATMQRQSGRLSRIMRASADSSADGFEKSFSRIKQGFLGVNRSAGTFARIARVSSRASVSEFGQVTASLDQTRRGANAAALAVRSIGAAARTIPRTVRPAIRGGSSNSVSGSGVSGTDALTFGTAAIGLGSGAMLAHSIANAGSLQQATIQAAIATGRMGGTLAQTTANMRDFRDIAFNMSTMTGQSISDSMGVVATMASSGVGIGQIKSIYKPIAQFTDVLHFGKDKMDYGEAAGLGAGLVHDMRLMNSADTAYGLGRIAQLAYLSPHHTDQLATQVRRMAPMLENVLPGSVQSRADQITLLAAWADRMGNLPFAGSAISQMTTQMISPRSKRVLGSLEALGVYDTRGNNRFFDQKTGTFDVMGALMQVQKHMDQARLAGKSGPAVEALFGGTQNMQRIMMALTSKESLTAYNALKKQMAGMGNDPVAWMNKVQMQLMSQLDMQTQRLTSDFGTLQAMIGDKLLPMLTPLVSKLADMTEHITKFLDTHPTAARGVAAGLAGLGAAGVAAGLAMGGYVATRIWHNIPGIGHTSAWLGHHFRGLGVGAARAGGGGVLGLGRSVAGGAGRIVGLGIFEDLGKLASHVNLLGMALKRGLILEVLTRGIFKLGLRAVPVVGDVLMLVDAIKFLGNHSTDIGAMLGDAVYWINNTGRPMLVDAFHNMINNMIQILYNFIKDPFAAIRWLKAQAVAGGNAFSAHMRGDQYTLPKAFKAPEGISGFGISPALLSPAGSLPNTGIPGLNLPEPTRAPMKLATGGLTRGNGLAFLHKNELVVNDRLTRKLDRMTENGGERRHQRERSAVIRHEHRVILEGGIPSNPRDLRRLAHEIADILGWDVALDSRSGGSIPEMLSHSVFGVTQGMPA